MKLSREQISALLAAKRIACPDDEYWRDFICEFHQRQREKLAAGGWLAGVWRRFTALAADLSPAKWAYGFGLAYAAVTVAFFLVPSEVEVEVIRPLPVNHQVIPAPPPVPAKNGGQQRPASDIPAVQTPMGGPAF